MASYKEADFEAAVERELIERGYLRGNAADFDAELALIPNELFAFLETSQASVVAQLRKEHGTSFEAAVVDALTKHLKSQGTLGVLRHGFKVYGRRLSAAFFRPAHGLNPDLEAQYAANRLVVTRQVRFDPHGESSVDLLLSLNGLPFATLELKNALTGQTVVQAKAQYADRDFKLPLFVFKQRALVHFAVDTDEVYMTTRLSGRRTFFLPFNRGNAGGKGNPTIEGEPYKTSYLWRQVLARDSILDVLARFMHLLTEEKSAADPADTWAVGGPDGLRPVGGGAPERASRRKLVAGGKTQTSETLIFPRYHQLDVVRRLEAAAKDEGPGHHYLIQHSAGSGKSNSIAWVAHRLASLHDAMDRKVFDSVIVVTDRRVLDRQLQDTIYQFEHKQGVVEKIDQNAAQLAKALEQGTPIVITTLQKFPFVTEKIGGLPSRRYAVIVDEAHSSQGGESAAALRSVLGEASQPKSAKGAKVQSGAKDVGSPGAAMADASPTYGKPDEDAQDPDEPTYEDEIVRTMASRGKQKNLSFFAFTATPKAKTLEVFGRPNPSDRAASRCPSTSTRCARRSKRASSSTS